MKYKKPCKPGKQGGFALTIFANKMLAIPYVYVNGKRQCDTCRRASAEPGINVTVKELRHNLKVAFSWVRQKAERAKAVSDSQEAILLEAVNSSETPDFVPLSPTNFQSSS